nr:hypothetical protein [Tanacetum cinerariifolium]
MLGAVGEMVGRGLAGRMVVEGVGCGIDGVTLLGTGESGEGSGGGVRVEEMGWKSGESGVKGMAGKSVFGATNGMQYMMLKNEVACLMLGSMTPELHRQFENYSPYEMLKELKSMFEKQARVERCDLIQTFHACKQEEGKPVGAYVLNTKDYVEQLECLSYVLLQYLSVGLILNGHTSDFARFGLRGARKMEQRALYLYVGNGVHAQVEAIGSFDLVLPNGLVICLDNFHYAPTITRGVVSVHRLVENGFVQCFTDYGILVSKNDIFYFNAIPCDGIYEIDMHNLVPNVNSIYNVSNKRSKHNLDSTYLWHYRLAHISKKRIEKLKHEGF